MFREFVQFCYTVHNGKTLQVRVLSKNIKLLSFNREQTYDVLFEGDDEEKSVATLLLDAIINVRFQEPSHFGFCSVVC